MTYCGFWEALDFDLDGDTFPEGLGEGFADSCANGGSTYEASRSLSLSSIPANILDCTI